MRICKGTKKKPNIQIPNPHHNEENLLHNIANMLKFADRKSISAICDYRMVGLADCNNFFVSCERTLDPSLEGRPVVVLSNNDGCAIARSNEAKRLGVKMGQPAFELRDLIAEKYTGFSAASSRLQSTIPWTNPFWTSQAYQPETCAR